MSDVNLSALFTSELPLFLENHNFQKKSRISFTNNKGKLANHIRTMKGQGEIVNDITKLNSHYQLAILQLNSHRYIISNARVCVCVCMPIQIAVTL